MLAFGDAFIAHVRAVHPDWPYPDLGIRNYAEATQRLTGAKERVEAVGDVEIQPISEARLDDWLSFFDHCAFSDHPGWTACYCTEPHLLEPGIAPEAVELRPWPQNRATMVDFLRSRRAFGYLAYVDGIPAGWVNASTRNHHALYRLGAGADPADGEVVGVACFVIAPPYRRHGLAAQLLARVLADAPGRGMAWVESYPINEDRTDDASHFRGPRSRFEANGFEPVEVRERYTVMRRRV